MDRRCTGQQRNTKNPVSRASPILSSAGGITLPLPLAGGVTFTLREGSSPSPAIRDDIIFRYLDIVFRDFYPQKKKEEDLIGEPRAPCRRSRYLEKPLFIVWGVGVDTSG